MTHDGSKTAASVCGKASRQADEFLGAEQPCAELDTMIDGIWFLISRQYTNWSSFDYFQRLVDLGDALQP